MKNYYIIILLFASTLLLNSCKEDDPITIYRVGLISSTSGWGDKGFNDNAREGLEYMESLENIEALYLETIYVEDQEENISQLISDSCDLIIGLGTNMKDDLTQAAIENPEIDFLLIDIAADTLLSNLISIVFDVEESAFPCGYLAAWYAEYIDTIAPCAAWIGGMDIAVINQFKIPFIKGIEYYNDENTSNVAIAGNYLNGFDLPEQGEATADSLINSQSADIIFTFAGGSGAGALQNIADNDKVAIGVDVDQFYTFPDIQEIFLTSCVKRLDYAVADIVAQYSTSIFMGNSILHYNLLNQGIGLASLHSFNDIVPDSVVTDISNILVGIKAGDIDTGWPEEK